MPRSPAGAADDGDDDDDDRVIDELDGYEAPPLPPLGPDHGPVLTPAPLELAPPPGQGLCAAGPAGPCAHYHRLVVSIDAQQPLGKVVGQDDQHLTLAPDDGDDDLEHEAKQELHTCYPAPGVEFDLGERHVYACNRYRGTGLVSITKRPAPRSGRPSKKPPRRTGRARK